MTVTDEHPRAASTGRRRGGPPLPAPALAWAALTVAAAVTHPGTRPGADPAATQTLLVAHPVLAPLSAVLLLASAAPLAVWTAAIHHRLTVLGARVAGPAIALVGGVLAVGALALSGLTGWATAVTAPLGAPLAQAGTVLAFAAGGAGFALALALLVAGVAVPVLVLGLVPRALGVAGLAVAALGVVALLSLLLPPLGVLLPVVRFGGLIWLVAVSLVLPLHRLRTHDREPSPRRTPRSAAVTSRGSA